MVTTSCTECYCQLTSPSKVATGFEGLAPTDNQYLENSFSQNEREKVHIVLVLNCVKGSHDHEDDHIFNLPYSIHV